MTISFKIFPYCSISHHPRKGLDPSFDFKKLSFVQEASGRRQEEQLMSAQSSVNNARKNSLQAAFNLFATNLANDQILQDKYLASADMSSQRTRSILVHSLEASRVQQKGNKHMFFRNDGSEFMALLH